MCVSTNYCQSLHTGLRADSLHVCPEAAAVPLVRQSDKTWSSIVSCNSRGSEGRNAEVEGAPKRPEVESMLLMLTER